MVEFNDLWRGHPTNRSDQFPCRVLKPTGDLRFGQPRWANQCAIRMGICLKNAGVEPGVLRGAITCDQHDPSEMHYLRAEEVARALMNANIPGIGERELLAGEKAQGFYDQIFGRQGLMLIKDYWSRRNEPPGRGTGDHIDVWNGYRSSSGWLMQWFSYLGYYGGYDKARQIWFWEVKQ